MMTVNHQGVINENFRVQKVGTVEKITSMGLSCFHSLRFFQQHNPMENRPLITQPELS